MAQDWFAQNAPKSAKNTGDWFAANAPSTAAAPDFTANPKGEGLYQMAPPGGEFKGVPYSKVMAASAAGWKIKPEDRETYAKDRFATLQLPTRHTGVDIVRAATEADRILTPGELKRNTGPLGAGISLEGRFTKGGQIIPQPPLPEAAEAPPGVWQRWREAMQQHAVPTGENRPTSLSQTNSLVDSAWNLGANLIDKAENITGITANTIFGAVDMIPQIYSASKDFLTSYDPEKAASGAQRLMQMMPAEMAKQYMAHLDELHKQNPEYAGDDIIGTALGIWATGKLTKKIARSPKELREAATKRLRGVVGEEPVKNLVAQTTKKNVGVAEKAAEVKAENEKAAAEHKAAVEKNLQERAGAETDAALREQAEQQHKVATEKYFAKEDAAAVKAKGVEDNKWQSWRDKMKGATVDGADIATPLEEITKISPQVAREIRLLTPDPAEAEPSSPYVQQRNEILKALGYKDPAAAYADMDDFNKHNIDKAVAERGFTPDPIDFNPKTGVEIPIEQIHRAKSIVGRNIANGRYEGPLLGEMKQLFKVLDQAETRASLKADALDDLQAAKAATQLRQEAFGRERTKRAMVGEMRKKGASREAVSEEQEEKRLAAAAKYDPSLVEDYRAVQEAEKRVNEHRTGEQARKSLKQAPARPEEKPVPQPVQVGPEEAQQAREEALHKGANWIRYRGKWIATSALIGRSLYDALHGRFSTVGEDMLMSGAAYSITGKAADFLERPGVKEWLSKPTPSDIQELMKLPADQRKEISDAWAPVIKEAKVKGVPIAPALATILAGSAAAQPAKSIKELRGEAEKNKPPETAAPTGPQSAARPYTHIFDEAAGRIIPA